MAFIAPYTTSMRRGQGYNSYAQEICLDAAVTIEDTDLKKLVSTAYKEATLSAVKTVAATIPSTSDSNVSDTVSTQDPVTNTTTTTTTLDSSNPDGSQSSKQTSSSVAANTISAIEKVARLLTPNAGDGGGANGSSKTAPEPGSAADIAAKFTADSEIRTRIAQDGVVLPVNAAVGMVHDGSAAISGAAPAIEDMPYRIVATEEGNRNQIVTYSTRSVQNISDIVSALNISSSLSIKYGSITGNASAAYVNEDKINDSDLNFVIQVKVTNEGTANQETMQFNEMEHLSAKLKWADRDAGGNSAASSAMFTKLYGDCFISDFIEGGEFSAIVSIKVSDKSQISAVSAAASASLTIGPSPLAVGGGAAMDKHHEMLLNDTEISISVNWIGGGEVKKPESQWTLKNLILIANAFPAMVCRHYTKTSAILTPYTSLRSFRQWQMNNDLDFRPLDYSTCQLYTDDLFSAYMSYKLIWKKSIRVMLRDASKYAAHKRPDTTDTSKAGTPKGADGTKQANNTAAQSSINVPITSNNDKLSNGTGNSSTMTTTPLAANRVRGWRVDETNKNRDPISLDPLELNNARLICREAMTLIVQEAAALVSDPCRAQVTFDEKDGCTEMKMPEYSFPEILDSRLPLGNERTIGGKPASIEDFSIIPNIISQDRNYYVGPFIGDSVAHGRHHVPFCSMALAPDYSDRISFLSIHGHKPSILFPSQFSRDADGAICGFGFSFTPTAESASGTGVRGTRKPQADGCTHHIGDVNFESAPIYKYRDLGARTLGRDTTRNELDICKLEVTYVPGTGRIAGVSFSDATTKQLEWMQPKTEMTGGLSREILSPPDDGQKWRFAGVAGMMDKPLLGGSHILAKIGAVWKRT